MVLSNSSPRLAPTVVNAHSGVILCMAEDDDGLLTGGDDGRFLRFCLMARLLRLRILALNGLIALHQSRLYAFIRPECLSLVC